MKSKLSISIILIIVFFLPYKSFTQTLNLGSLEPYSIFTAEGAISNGGTSHFSGYIGTNTGIVSGFEPPTTSSGPIYNSNATTAQARVDLLNVYINLNNIPVTNTTHAAAFVPGENVTPGVYLIPSAGSVGGTITLDGQGNSNSVFIFKFEGAFTMGAGASIVLTNATLSSNVIWISEGAISLGASANMKGILFAHSGAVSMGVNCHLDGRMFSTSGAISMDEAIVYKPTTATTISVNCQNSPGNPILGSIGNFALFSSAGAVANTGVSGIVGEIGSNEGAISGWGGSTILIGAVQNANSVTAQAKIDLQSAYNQIFNTPVTHPTHAAVFGNGETVTSGVYSVPAAGSLGGTLILDGQGNSNSIFIFKFGGAFSTGAKSKVILINGTQHENVFWIAEGAISMGAFTFMKGTLIAHDGANNMGANGFLEGRMLSTQGAVGYNTATNYVNNTLCAASGPLPIELTSFTGKCEQGNTILKWTTGSEINNKYFMVERSNEGINWEQVGRIAGSGHSSIQHSYFIIDNLPAKPTNYYYRLIQVDFDNKFTYSNIIIVNNCGRDISDKMVVFPNPSTGIFNLSLNDTLNNASLTEIFNAAGVKIYKSHIYKSQIDLSHQPSGFYIIRVLVNSKIISRRIELEK